MSQPEKQVFSLKQVVQSIQKTMEDRYSTQYWVKAEMHKMNRYPSGHAFPELVQKEGGKIVAQMTGNIWKQQLERINEAFIRVVKEPLQDGKTLLLLVKIQFHPTFGLTLQILDIDPSYSLGELQREREETLKKLEALQLINCNQTKEFPLLPKRIAIVSGDSSKGLSDFYQVLQENPYRYRFETTLFEAYVQGDLAVHSICAALEKIKDSIELFDVVVIVRGGGAEVGMTCYNHFDLCKSIASFPIPVLTGIGHSTNLTVAEMVAYRNAITPTQLAEFLVLTFREFDLEIQHLAKQMSLQSERSLSLKKQALTSAANLVHHGVIKRIQSAKERFLSLQFQVQSQSRNQLTIHLQHIENQATRLKPHVQFFLDKEERNLSQLAEKVKFLDPIHVLKRGYSITRINGKAIDENAIIQVDTEIVTQTIQGSISAKVTAISRNS
ncbi:MAG: exodeoxyribonuclease VII large subunit [Crocinitomicaceae bacterium]|jgi:exodeoxyribonuclease VII large subunit|nr:exodeoxyribonuclease VII large subunit [Crocinitomicaceae bacterium]MDP4761909.1 exodeoxyribonuclease VII large subunit [Crocinitomicaceae bacterium]